MKKGRPMPTPFDELLEDDAQDRKRGSDSAGDGSQAPLKRGYRPLQHDRVDTSRSLRQPFEFSRFYATIAGAMVVGILGLGAVGWYANQIHAIHEGVGKVGFTRNNKVDVLAKEKSDPKDKDEADKPQPVYLDPNRTLAPARAKTGNLAVAVTSAKIGVVKHRSGKEFERQVLILTVDFKNYSAMPYVYKGWTNATRLCYVPNGETLPRVPSNPSDPFEGMLADGTQVPSESTATDIVVFERPAEPKRDLELDLVPGGLGGPLPILIAGNWVRKERTGGFVQAVVPVPKATAAPLAQVQPGGFTGNQGAGFAPPPPTGTRGFPQSGGFMGNLAEDAPATTPIPAPAEKPKAKAPRKETKPKDPGTLAVGDKVIMHGDTPGGVVWAAKTEADFMALVEVENAVKADHVERKPLNLGPRNKLVSDGRATPYSDGMDGRVVQLTETAVLVQMTKGASKGWVRRELVKAAAGK
jgi:hypothetical protein